MDFVRAAMAPLRRRRDAPHPRPLRPYLASPWSMGRVAWRVAAIVLIIAFCLVYGFLFALIAPALISAFVAPLAVLALLIAWALPDVGAAPPKALSGLFFAFLVVVVVWPNYIALALPGLPWVTMQRLISGPLVVIFLFTLATSRDFRRQLGAVAGATPMIWKLFAAFILIQAASIVFSGSKGFSINRFIVDQLAWTMMYFLGSYVFLKPGRFERWAILLWGLAIFVCLVALVEYRLGHVPWAGHVPSFLAIEDPSVARTLAGSVRSAMGVYRVEATFSSPLGLGEYITLAMPFTLHFVVSNYDWRLRIAALLSVPLFFVIVLLADSRLGLIGCLMSVAMMLAVWGVLRWRNVRGSIIGPAVVMTYPVVAGVAVLATFFIGRLRTHVWGGGAQQISTQGRTDQWHMGWPKIFSAPWGHGIGMSADVLGYIPEGSDFVTIDSYYLSLLLDYGPIGFAVYFAIMLVAVGTAAFHGILERVHDRDTALLTPVAIALANFCVIKSVYAQEDSHAVVFMMLGAVSALVYRLKEKKQQAVQPAALPVAA